MHGLVGRIFSARRGDSDFGREPEAEVGVGRIFPCWRSGAARDRFDL